MRTDDPMERGFAELCARAGIACQSDDHRSGLDFYLPDFDVYVEVKQYHSDRIAEQMSRRPNVIAIQGRTALAAFAKMVGDPHDR